MHTHTFNDKKKTRGRIVGKQTKQMFDQKVMKGELFREERRLSFLGYEKTNTHVPFERFIIFQKKKRKLCADFFIW